MYVSKTRLQLRMFATIKCMYATFNITIVFLYKAELSFVFTDKNAP